MAWRLFLSDCARRTVLFLRVGLLDVSEVHNINMHEQIWYMYCSIHELVSYMNVEMNKYGTCSNDELMSHMNGDMNKYGTCSNDELCYA